VQGWGCTKKEFPSRDGGALIPTYSIEAEEHEEYIVPKRVGFYDGNGGYHEFEGDDPIWRFLTFVRTNYHGISIYANNAIDTDHKILINCLARHGERIKMDGGMSKIKWPRGEVTFLDSYSMMAMSLNKAARAMDVPRKAEGEWTPNELTCKTLSKTLDAFYDLLFNTFGVEPSSTISLTSVKIFDRNFYQMKGIHHNQDFEACIRQATFAGRNEVYTRMGENVNLYDIRGNYISCYDVPVPVGKLVWVQPNLERGTLAEARAYVPERFVVGPLPYRIDGKLGFPVGHLHGWWDTRELKFAAELGCDVELIRQLGGHEEPALAEFGRDICRLRDEAEYGMDNPDLGGMWKTIGLRLCGKLGQNREKAETKHVREIEDRDGWYPLDETETYYEKHTLQEGSRMPFVKPAVNMRIRAEARIRHARFLLEAIKLGGKVYYCDTDSVYTDSFLPTGKGHGELQLKDWAQDIYIIKCKTYGYVDKAGVMVQRTAGFRDVALTEKEFKEILGTGRVLASWKCNSGWKRSLDGHMKAQKRQMSIQDDLDLGNRILLENNVDTAPMNMRE